MFFDTGSAACLALALLDLGGPASAGAAGCVGLQPPSNGGNFGSCPPDGSLAHGASCQPQCVSGAFATGGPVVSCNNGTLTPATVPDCQFPSCKLSAPPKHGSWGDCLKKATLPHNAVCTPSCGQGYKLTATDALLARAGMRRAILQQHAAHWCSAGRLVESFCSPEPCLVGSGPDYGTRGDCPKLLASGQTCQPRCLTPYEATGKTFCNASKLEPTKCIKGLCGA
jgi:hypothetical protein